MAEFSNQGVLSVTGTVLLTGGPSTTSLNRLFTLRLNNAVAYNIQLYIYKASTATTTLMYALNLSAGDTLTDDINYALSNGDQIIAYSSVVGTTFYIYGVTY
jgi:hypothetical protein